MILGIEDVVFEAWRLLVMTTLPLLVVLCSGDLVSALGARFVGAHIPGIGIAIRIVGGGLVLMLLVPLLKSHFLQFMVRALQG